MKTDIEIAQENVMQPITEVCEDKLGINDDCLEAYGKYKAKLSEEYLKTLKSKKKGKKHIMRDFSELAQAQQQKQEAQAA